MAVRKPRPTLETHPGAEAFLPVKHSLPSLRIAANTCRGCPLHQGATQAVFGAGTQKSRVMFIGEQPGSSEDLAGKPFVGPAGRLLDDALALAGIDRDLVYVTNAVKHFKYTLRGKRRIHDKPTRYEIAACRPWLDAELEVVEPDIIVLLGATAAQALLGNQFRVTKSRGVAIESGLARYTFATVHPASVLRAPNNEARRQARESFFADIAVVGDHFRRL
jgi:uracil-DNA glycosylase family protein